MDKMGPVQVVGLCGSLRKYSYNGMLLARALFYAKLKGAECIRYPSEHLILPLLNEDSLLDGVPLVVRNLKQIVGNADVLFIATPEYNHSISGVLKNALDWISYKGNPLEGKVAGIMGASTGQFGTVRAQIHLRQILSALGVHVIEKPQLFVPYAAQAFRDDGSLSDHHLETIIEQLVDICLLNAQGKK
ncbi:MAG: NAD(P)H-dependent oxidoreductase [Bacteroidetes bacterium]|nr:NAD(P)H-dependent oxidoreductase [Bacteroidota bacterium]